MGMPRAGHRWTIVDGIAEDVKHPAQRLPPNRHGDGRSGVDHRKAAPQAGRVAHGDGAHGVGVDVLLHLNNQISSVIAVDD